jgi:hypothetical protein
VSSGETSVPKLEVPAKHGAFDRLTKAAAEKASRRRFLGVAVGGGAAAIMFQMLGIRVPPASAQSCNTCCASSCGVCNSTVPPCTCVSPNGQWCNGEATCTGCEFCNCVPAYAACVDICDNGTQQNSCPPCAQP